MDSGSAVFAGAKNDPFFLNIKEASILDKSIFYLA
jgi:hypothetical protein